MIDFSTSDKTTILIHLLDFQAKEIQRRESREQKLFEWTVGVLLAAFGAVVALSNREQPLPHPFWIKLFASCLIGIPTFIFCLRILKYSKKTIENGEAIDKIERILRLYEKETFGGETPYPENWANGLSISRKKRKTQYFYSLIMAIMAVCVISTVCLIL
ncbi:MAG: hypothetical protein M3209_12135 [Acidobacteriota bacterium]|nr:hypothetical protein [Acidobacteriota bacterium]